MKLRLGHQSAKVAAKVLVDSTVEGEASVVTEAKAADAKAAHELFSPMETDEDEAESERCVVSESMGVSAWGFLQPWLFYLVDNDEVVFHLNNAPARRRPPARPPARLLPKSRFVNRFASLIHGLIPALSSSPVPCHYLK